MKAGSAILLGIVIAGLLAFGDYTFMMSMIPPGQPMAKVVEPFNDPNDLTPRAPFTLKGPHQDEFVNNCTACHSIRLTLTQPSFPAAKWTEIVKKMVTVYGAKIDPPVEAEIVKYLATVKGVK